MNQLHKGPPAPVAAKRWRIAFIAIPGLAFVITCLVLWPKSERIDPLAADAPPALDFSVPQNRLNSRPTPGPSPPPSPPSPLASASAQAPPKPVATSTETSMPIKFIFRAARGDVVAAANLINLSDDAIDMTVTAVNGKTYLRSVVALSLQPHKRENLLTAGLQITSGDQVTLHSPPFPDQNVVAQ